MAIWILIYGDKGIRTHFWTLIHAYLCAFVWFVSRRCIRFCNDAKLLDKFRESAKLLDMVQKGLSDYLETKRAGFSRFYFLSNDELLEILSQTKVGTCRAYILGTDNSKFY